MINFENLIKAIHDSAISANQAIMHENLKLLDMLKGLVSRENYLLLPTKEVSVKNVVMINALVL